MVIPVTVLLSAWLGIAPEPAEVVAPEPVDTEATGKEMGSASIADVPVDPARAIEFETYEGDPIGVRKFVLKNGLTVLLSENHERPVVFGSIVVDAGGKDDPADATGMAHYLEHMLFKGTRELGTMDYEAEALKIAELSRLYDELAAATQEDARARLQVEIDRAAQEAAAHAIPLEYEKLIGEIGGTNSNAYTTPDMTVYHNEFPASEMQAWLKIQAHRFDQPVFRLFPSELEAVYEEKNMSMDGFIDPLTERFLERVFPEHPYGTQSVLGSVEHLKKPSLAKMRAHYERQYVAGNMALVMVGDFDSDTVAPWIVDEFSGWRGGDAPKLETAPPRPFEGRETLTVRMTPVRAGAVAFRTVEPTHEDAPALEIAEAMLSNEEGSGFIDALGDEGQLVMAMAMPMGLDEAGMTIIFFVPKILGQGMRAAERLVLEQLAKLSSGDFEDERLHAVRDSAVRDYVLAFEDNEARGDLMAMAFAREQSWGEFAGQISALSEVTRDDVQAVAARYWGDDYFVMRSRMGFPKRTRLDKPSMAPVEPTPGASSSFYERAREFPRAPSRPRFLSFEEDLRTHELQPGVVLEVHPNPINDIYSLELKFGIGRYALPELWVLGAYLKRAGAGNRSGQALKHAFQALSTTYEFEATEDGFFVRLQGPERHMSRALSLLDELMQRPVADERAFRRLRAERRAESRIAERDPGYLSDALQDYAVHGDDSVYLRDPGPRTLKRMGTKGLLSAWRQTIGYGTRVTYVGRESPERVAAQLREELTFAEAPRPAVPPVVLERRVPNGDTTYLLATRRALQTHMGYWIDGDPLDVGEDPLARAFNEYVAGESSGLIFKEVRELRALAYTAYGYYRTPRIAGEPGRTIAYVACQGDKTDETSALMRDLLSDMPAREEMMPGMRTALLHGIETEQPSFRGLPARIHDWQRRGFQEDPRRRRQLAYPDMTFGEVMDFYGRHVRGRPIVQTIVGDTRRFDVDRVVGGGARVKVKRRELFSP
jgi:predicted Zn-dependent peptidase